MRCTAFLPTSARSAHQPFTHIVDVLYVHAVLVCAVLQDQLLQVEESPLVRHMLPQLQVDRNGMNLDNLSTRRGGWQYQSPLVATWHADPRSPGQTSTNNTCPSSGCFTLQHNPGATPARRLSRSLGSHSGDCTPYTCGAPPHTPQRMPAEVVWWVEGENETWSGGACKYSQRADGESTAQEAQQQAFEPHARKPKHDKACMPTAACKDKPTSAGLLTGKMPRCTLIATYDNPP